MNTRRELGQKAFGFLKGLTTDESESPTAVDAAPESGMTRGRFNTLILVFVAGCTSKSKPLAEIPAPATPPPSVEKPIVPFNPESYRPPSSSGVIIDSDIEPGRKKTVIYIVDEHPEAGTVTGEAEAHAQTVQRQLFEMLKDLYDKQGHLPVVVENWTNNAEKVDMTKVSPSGIGNIGGSDNLARILGVKDIASRQKLAGELAGTDLTPGTMYMMVAFPGVKPLGSANEAQVMSTLMDMGPLQDAAEISEYPESVPCFTKPDLTLAQAKSRFAAGDFSDEVLDCYCLARQQVNEVTERFIEDRFLAAARREVNRALTYDDGDFVVVSSGLTHLPEAMKHLKAATDTNWILVSPKALERAFPKALDTLAIEDPFPDSPARTCEKEQGAIALRLSRAQREESSKAIMDWMNDDTNLGY